jgi:hypothetical protein
VGAGLVGDDVDRGGAREATAQQLGKTSAALPTRPTERLPAARAATTREGSVEVVGVLVEVAVRDPALQTRHRRRRSAPLPR